MATTPATTALLNGLSQEEVDLVPLAESLLLEKDLTGFKVLKQKLNTVEWEFLTEMVIPSALDNLTDKAFKSWYAENELQLNILLKS
jgi:hypothetical protein